MKPATTYTIEDLEARVEELVEELAHLEGQLEDALAQIRRAEQKFAQLEAQRIELAPRAITGDEKARVELDGVELEQDEIANSSRVAEAAVPGLERMVADVKERLARAQKQVHKARAQVAHEKLKGVEARRDELAGELREVFAEHSRTHAAYTEAVRQYSRAEANDLATSRPDMHSRWLKKAFAKWF